MLRKAMEEAWVRPNIANAAHRTQWKRAGLEAIAPAPGAFLSIRVPPKLRPLYMQPRRGLPRRCRKACAVKHV